MRTHQQMILQECCFLADQEIELGPKEKKTQNPPFQPEGRSSVFWKVQVFLGSVLKSRKSYIILVFIESGTVSTLLHFVLGSERDQGFAWNLISILYEYIYFCPHRISISKSQLFLNFQLFTVAQACCTKKTFFFKFHGWVDRNGDKE